MLDNQKPTERVVPRYISNDAGGTIELMAAAGLELMQWQQLLLEAWMGVGSNCRWAAPTAGNQTPRQNGKTRVIQARAAAEMLFFGGTVIYTAQIQKTSTETFEEVSQLFDSQALRKYLAPHGIRTALGREEIRLKSGARMKFLARTKNGGNGQHGSLLIFDEAQYLDAVAQGSFMPAISACRTRRGAQTIYNGNAPDESDPADVFERIRADALSGKSKRTAWTSWGIDSSMQLPDVSDRSAWERVNPAWGILIDPDTVEAEFEVMDNTRFAHQRLGWFRQRASAEKIISREAWEACEVDEAPAAFDKQAFGVRFSPSGETVALAVAVINGERSHVEFVQEEPTAGGIAWLADWLAPRMKKAAAVCIDGRADAADLAIQLTSRGVPSRCVMVAGTQDAINASASFLNGVNDGIITHLDDPTLNEAALGAIRRPIGKNGGFGFGGDYAQRLDACALALWACKTARRDPKRKAMIW